MHSGRWAFRSGETAGDGEVVVEAGDVISLPPRMFRGFENVGAETGFLFAVLGSDDPGRVLWAPYVFDAAASYGLILMENGRLIDTRLGQTPPSELKRMRRTTAEEVAALDRYDSDQLRKCVRSDDSTLPASHSVLAARGHGVRETTILGPASDAEGLDSGWVARSHGFALRELEFSRGSMVPPHIRIEEEVLLMRRGALSVGVGEDRVVIRTGDVMTVPVGTSRRFENAHDGDTTVHVVRRGDLPAAPTFV